MKESVRQAFVPFTSPLEGVVPWMYLDVKGLVTCAIGNLIDPISMALGLPFVRSDGAPASHDEIAAEWQRVKERQDLRLRGGVIFKTVTTLRLTPDGVDEVVWGKLRQMEAYLQHRFPAWDAWPADAQLATFSMSWACGPAFHFVALERALLAGKFGDAANCCHIAGGGTIVERNRRNTMLYRNAAIVVSHGHDPNVLWWPQALPDERPTEPVQPSQIDLTTVAGVQERLAELGYDVGPADGELGPRTEAAIRAFQAAHGLVADGIVGPQTRAALRAG